MLISNEAAKTDLHPSSSYTCDGEHSESNEYLTREREESVRGTLFFNLFPFPFHDHFVTTLTAAASHLVKSHGMALLPSFVSYVTASQVGNTTAHTVLSARESRFPFSHSIFVQPIQGFLNDFLTRRVLTTR